MVSELAGEGAMSPQLPTPARRIPKIAELRDRIRIGVAKSKEDSFDRLRQLIRSGKLKHESLLAMFNLPFLFFNLSVVLSKSSSWSRSVRNSNRVLVVAFSSWRKSMENMSAELVTINRSSQSRSAENSSAELTVVISSPQRRTRKKLSTSTTLVVNSVSNGKSPTIPTQNSSMDCRSRSVDFVFVCVSLLRQGEQPVFDSDFAYMAVLLPVSKTGASEVHSSKFQVLVEKVVSFESLDVKKIGYECTGFGAIFIVVGILFFKSLSSNIYYGYGASKEISNLETEPSSIRSLLSTQAILVHDLTKEDVHIDSLFDSLPDSASNSSSIDEISEPSEIENWLTVSNIVDNSLAFLRNSQEIDIPVEHYFDKLQQKEQYVLAGLVCLLREVRLFFTTGDAMWCLLICDMDMSQAFTMDSDLLSNSALNGVLNHNPIAVVQSQLKTESNNAESITEKESSNSLFDTGDKYFSAAVTSHPSSTANEKAPVKKLCHRSFRHRRVNDTWRSLTISFVSGDRSAENPWSACSITQYMKFKSVYVNFICDGDGSLANVPNSRKAIFKDGSWNSPEKNQLMRILHSVSFTESATRSLKSSNRELVNILFTTFNRSSWSRSMESVGESMSIVLSNRNSRSRSVESTSRVLVDPSSVTVPGADP
nr:putative E3 ubiquitin-protein ligase RF298 isoform X2 [Ipomoea batatas]